MAAPKKQMRSYFSAFHELSKVDRHVAGLIGQLCFVYSFIQFIDIMFLCTYLCLSLFSFFFVSSHAPSFFCLFICLFIHFFVPSLIQSFILSAIYLFIYSLIHFPSRSLAYSPLISSGLLLMDKYPLINYH